MYIPFSSDKIPIWVTRSKFKINDNILDQFSYSSNPNWHKNKRGKKKSHKKRDIFYIVSESINQENNNAIKEKLFLRKSKFEFGRVEREKTSYWSILSNLQWGSTFYYITISLKNIVNNFNAQVFNF